MEQGINIENVRIGDVISISLGIYDGIHPKDGYPERRKFFIVLGICNGYMLLGGVVINSVINMRLPKVIRLYHIPIESEKYPFLKYDSYVDCSTLIKPRFSRLKSAFLLGRRDDADMSEILSRIRTSPGIAPIDLDLFGLRKTKP